MSVLKKLFCVSLAALMCTGAMGLSVYAQSLTENGTIWFGDELSVGITTGTNGYDIQSVYAAPRHAYEMSNHMVSTDGGINNDIPQTLLLVDAGENYNWTPNGLYSFGTSNYETLYCCDAETGYVDRVHYKRLNLEDSAYYNAEQAAHIRAIVTNSYPFVSIDQMKKNLANEGFEAASDLTRAEIITAVQAAIWYYANEETYQYSRTFHVPSNSQWGGIIHDYTNEMDVWWGTGKRVFTINEEVGNRINALIEHLKNQTEVYAQKNQIIISGLEIEKSIPVADSNGLFTIDLKVALNNSGSSVLDDIELNVYVDGNLCASKDIQLGTEVYNFSVKARAGQTIKAIVSGKQILPEGVYFYEPEGGRDVSQCLVGVAEGETSVYAEDTITLPGEISLPAIFFKPGTASNISFMLVDKDGNVEFLYKVDLNSKDSAKLIETKEGYISAVFVKQSTSGMVWVSEEVDDDVLDNIIACIKNNNKSYKGHDAVAFGEGSHNLTYKKKNTVTYDFNYAIDVLD